MGICFRVGSSEVQGRGLLFPLVVAATSVFVMGNNTCDRVRDASAACQQICDKACPGLGGGVGSDEQTCLLACSPKSGLSSECEESIESLAACVSQSSCSELLTGATCGADLESAASCFDFENLPEKCCRIGDPCGWGDDGVCDCFSQAWDSADCLP